MMNKSEQERFWDGGAAPKPPRFIALRQDSWPERRAALALSESRPLSRRSGCVSAEPYPPLRSVQSIRDTMEKKKPGRLHKTLDAPNWEEGMAENRTDSKSRLKLADGKTIAETSRIFEICC